MIPLKHARRLRLVFFVLELAGVIAIGVVGRHYGISPWWALLVSTTVVVAQAYGAADQRVKAWTRRPIEGAPITPGEIDSASLHVTTSMAEPMYVSGAKFPLGGRVRRALAPTRNHPQGSVGQTVGYVIGVDLLARRLVDGVYRGPQYDVRWPSGVQGQYYEDELRKV